MFLNRIRHFLYFKFVRIFTGIIILCLCGIVLFLQFFHMPQRLLNTDFIIKEGFLDLSEYSLIDSRPIMLHGMWEYTPQDGNTVYEKLPFTLYEKSTIPARYKVSIKTSESSPHIKLYIPDCDPKIIVRVNGKELENPLKDLFDKGEKSGKLFLVNFDPNLEIQDIEIIKNSNISLLYKSMIILGYDSAILSTLLKFHDIGLFNIGILIFLLINSLSFVIIRIHENEKISNLIILFNTMLVLHIMFTIPEAKDLIIKLFLSDKIADPFFLSSVQIFLLMLTCIAGFYLCRFLLDIKRKIILYINHFMAGLFLIYSIVFTVNVEWFESFGYKIVGACFLLAFSFMIVENICECLKEKMSKYHFFQIFGILLVISLIFIDIIMTRTDFNFKILFCGFMVFFFMNLMVRLIEVNNDYKKIALLNKKLNESNIRDPLTKAYNRLYLEAELEKFMNNPNLSLHLCMFDLDWFKKVNDIYGHDVGDKQLCFLVDMINGQLNENSLVARVGGEEFVIVAKGFTDKEMLNMVEKIRYSLEKSKEEHPEYTTASFGIAKYESGMAMKELFKVADSCLYIAKAAGKNKIVQDIKGVPIVSKASIESSAL